MRILYADGNGPVREQNVDNAREKKESLEQCS